MEKTAKANTIIEPASFKVFKILVNAAWYIGWISLGVVIVYLVLNAVSDEKYAFIVSPYEVPARVIYKQNSSDTPIINRETDDVVFIGHRTTYVYFDSKSAWVLITIYQGMWTGAILWIAFCLRKLIKAIKSGKPFKNEIIKRIRSIGIFIICLGPFLTIVRTRLYSSLIHDLEIRANSSIVKTPITTEVDLNLYIILIGIIILVISYIFQIGAQIQKENELTV